MSVNAGSAIFVDTNCPAVAGLPTPMGRYVYFADGENEWIPNSKIDRLDTTPSTNNERFEVWMELCCSSLFGVKFGFENTTYTIIGERPNDDSYVVISMDGVIKDFSDDELRKYNLCFIGPALSKVYLQL